ncbi:MAG: metal ABC transporter ATP-binding protein [Gemmatimonadota bacterium]
MSRPALVRFEDVALGYGRHAVLEHLTFTLGAGDFLGLVGPNGAGKSTIVKALLGLMKPQAGRIVYERPLHTELRFGYVPQRHTLDAIFPLSVADIVRMARYREAGVLRRPGPAAEAAVAHALDAVGITHLAGRRFDALSGGQRQRALIARALATGATCLVLDEPTDGMDLGSQHAILELIRRLHRDEHLTVVFVSHLLNEVATYVDRLALLDEGRFDHGPVEEILTAPRLGALYATPVRVERIGDAVVVLPG